MLLSPAANHVYRQASGALAAAELAVTAPFAHSIRQTTLAGAAALEFEADELDHLRLAAQSTQLVTFERVGDLLRPIELPRLAFFDDDLVTIPKYQGKTNEVFTRLLLHLTLSAVQRPGPLDVLDPLAGRGTTLLAAWQAGHHAYGVEADDKSFEALSAYLKTYLRTKRIKHSAQVSPVRRDGRAIGRRLDAAARLGEATSAAPARPGMPTLQLTVFTGDTRDSAVLYGRKRFDAILTDAPYGVVHGAYRAKGPSPRDRSPRQLLSEAIPVWRGQLKPGGALGISWNTLTLPRAELGRILLDAGLRPRDDDPWQQFGHRVDSSIHRDLMVATTS
jgi:hypothetical protein